MSVKMAQRTASAKTGEYSYVRFLERCIADARGEPKSERTRLQLERSGAVLLQRLRYDELTVAEVTQEAGLAHGTFYRYFKNRRDFVLAIYTGLSRSIHDLRPRGRHADETRRGTIQRMNAFYVRYYRDNAELMRSYVSLKTEDPDFAHIGLEADRWLATKILRDIDPNASGTTRDARFLMAHAMMAMVDELLRKIYCGVDESLAEFRDRPEEIAEILTELWWSSLYK